MQKQQSNLPTSMPEEGKAVALAARLVIYGILPMAKPENGKGEQADSETTGGIIQLIAPAILFSEYHMKQACEC